jgi:hypothetical protein
MIKILSALSVKYSEKCHKISSSHNLQRSMSLEQKIVLDLGDNIIFWANACASSYQDERSISTRESSGGGGGGPISLGDSRGSVRERQSSLHPSSSLVSHTKSRDEPSAAIIQLEKSSSSKISIRLLVRLH